MKTTRMLLLVALLVPCFTLGCGQPIVLQQKVTLPYVTVMSGQQFPLPSGATAGMAFTNQTISYAVNANMLPTETEMNEMVAAQLESVLGDFVHAEIVSIELVSLKLTATSNNFSFLTGVSSTWTPAASGSAAEPLGNGVFNPVNTEISLTPSSPLSYDDVTDGGTLALLISGTVPENTPIVSVGAQVAVTVKVTISL